MTATTPIERAVDHLEYCTSAAEESQLPAVEVDTRYLRALISEHQALRTKLTAALQAISRISSTADLTRYLPGNDGAGRLAIWCSDRGDPTNPLAPAPIWTEDDASEQVTELCLANLVAVVEEHDREHHRDEPEHSNALTPEQQASLGRPCLCYPVYAAEG